MIVLIVVLLVAGGLWYAQPLLALRALKQSLESRDETGVGRQVDFAALRTAVIDHAHRKIDKSNDDKVLSGLRDTVEHKLADIKIESLATPSGLIHLVCDQTADGDVDTSSKPAGTPCHLDGKVQSFRYTSSTRFDVLVRRQKGGDMTLTMGKNGDGWHLVDLIGKQ